MKTNVLSIISKTTAGYLLFMGLSMVMIMQIFSYEPLYFVLAEIIMLVITVIFLHRLQWGVLLFLFLRPSIDRQAEYLSVNITADLTLNIAAIFGILLIVFVILYIGRYVALFSTVPLRYTWLLFISVLGVGVFYSIEAMASLYELIRVTSIFAIFVLAILALNDGLPYMRILYTIVLSAIIPFIFAAYQIVFDAGLTTTPGVDSRIYGTFSHPSPFAFYVLTVVAICFYLLHIGQKNLMVYSAFAAAVIVLIGTFTRGAWLALLTFLSIVGIMRVPKIFFGMVACAILLFFMSTTIHDRVEDIYNPPSDSSIRWRFTQWENMYGVALHRPLVGHGTGTETIAHYYAFGPDAGNQYTHNDYLKMFIENGILGVGAFLLLMVTTIILIFRRYRMHRGTAQGEFALMILALFAVFALVAVGDNVIRSTATQWVIWTLVAIALAPHVTWKQKRSIQNV